MLHQIVKRKSSRSHKKQDKEYHHIYQSQFAFRKEAIMNIEESYSHGYGHRNKNQPLQQSCYKEEGAAEFTKYGKHQRCIASQPHYTRKTRLELIEVHHLVHAMHEEEYAEKYSYGQNQEGDSLTFEILWKKKIVKHTNQF